MIKVFDCQIGHESCMKAEIVIYQKRLYIARTTYMIVYYTIYIDGVESDDLNFNFSFNQLTFSFHQGNESWQNSRANSRLTRELVVPTIIEAKQELGWLPNFPTYALSYVAIIILWHKCSYFWTTSSKNISWNHFTYPMMTIICARNWDVVT